MRVEPDEFEKSCCETPHLSPLPLWKGGGEKDERERANPKDACSRELPLTFQREKGSALLVRIPSLWAGSDPSPQCLYLAIWRDEANSFAQLVFLFSRACEFQKQWDSATERSRHPARAFSLIATQIGRSILPQRVPQPPAFLQA